MLGPGTASEISRAMAEDLLSKFITESTKVQAMLVGRGGVTAAVQGTLSSPQQGTVVISQRKSATDASLTFGLDDVSKFMYADSRAFPSFSGIPGTPNLRSAILFAYPDGVQIGVFEIDVPS
jgi:hypothetical protein